MPSTKTHDICCLSLGAAQLGLGYLLKEPSLYLSSVGSFAGLLISPDWDWVGFILINLKTYQTELVSEYDLEAFNQDEWAVSKVVLGKVARRWPKFLHSYLTLYAKGFKHRGLSHVYVFGTLLRLAFLIWPVLVVILFPEAWYAVLGLMLADFVHSYLDFNLKKLGFFEFRRIHKEFEE